MSRCSAGSSRIWASTHGQSAANGSSRVRCSRAFFIWLGKPPSLLVLACGALAHARSGKLCKPDALTMLDTPVSLKRLKLPAFVFAAREDHIVPWRGAYASARCLGGKVTFVLGASGHIAGTINPASKGKRSYWMNAKRPADAEKWLVGAREHPGSWWTEWSRWLAPHAGKLVPARKTLGDGRKKPIEPAPGSYAKEKNLTRRIAWHNASRW